MTSDLIRPLIKIIAVVLCFATMTGSVRPTQLELVRMQGSLVVVTRNSPTTFFEDRTGQTGYELELARAFANHLNVELKVIVADNIQDIFNTLETGKAAFAAAGLTQTSSRERWVRFTEPYKQVSELVIYRRGSTKPSAPADLSQGRIIVSAASSHAERLHEWQITDVPALSWGESPDMEVSDLLQAVAAGNIDYTLVDSNEFRMLQAYYPTLDVAFEVEGVRQIAWAFPYSRDDSLYKEANAFFNAMQDTTLFAALSERFYGHLDTLDYVGARIFLRQADKKLIRYKPHFMQAAETHGFDWRLLAAVGYQESHWNPEARSFTGVRGLMMLTRQTAKEVGVTNRLDPVQSIQGGSQYLSYLRGRLQDVQEPDRTWLTLAAYNVGLGHLNDARKITTQLGGDPNSWMDVKEALPLLSQKRYYRYTRHGYARGQEPVTYVQNIRRYYDVLVWNDEQGGSGRSPDEMVVSNNVTFVPPLL